MAGPAVVRVPRRDLESGGLPPVCLLSGERCPDQTVPVRLVGLTPLEPGELRRFWMGIGVVMAVVAVVAVVLGFVAGPGASIGVAVSMPLVLFILVTRGSRRLRQHREVAVEAQLPMVKARWEADTSQTRRRGVMFVAGAGLIGLGVVMMSYGGATLRLVGLVLCVPGLGLAIAALMLPDRPRVFLTDVEFGAEAGNDTVKLGVPSTQAAAALREAYPELQQS